MTSLYGYPAAQVTVKDASGKIVGLSQTPTDGKFELQINSNSAFYEPDVVTPTRRTSKTFSHDDAVAKTMLVDMGNF